MRRYRDVSRAYDSAIRIADLSWTHHLVAATHPDREALLQRARDEHWTVERLREVVRGMPADLWEALNNLDAWFHQHHIVSTEEKRGRIIAVCQRRRVLPLIEDMRATGSTIPYVWAGYILPGENEHDGGTVIYHPGWARYCRHFLHDDATVTVSAIMPEAE